MKLCECGCGLPAPIAKKTNTRRGHVKGQPIRFIVGHHNKQWGMTPPNPSGLCECGCGQPAPMANVTDLSRGYVAGQPRRFVIGHGIRVKSIPHYKKHGLHDSPEYTAYDDAKRRCRKPTHKSWKDYGGRGIEFRFTSFPQFFAELGPRPEGMSLDRKDNDGHYEPGNVRWATWSEQRRNQRKRKVA